VAFSLLSLLVMKLPNTVPVPNGFKKKTVLVTISESSEKPTLSGLNPARLANVNEAELNVNLLSVKPLKRIVRNTNNLLSKMVNVAVSVRLLTNIVSIKITLTENAVLLGNMAVMSALVNLLPTLLLVLWTVSPKIVLLLKKLVVVLLVVPNLLIDELKTFEKVLVVLKLNASVTLLVAL
jgi:hypothetical protein